MSAISAKALDPISLVDQFRVAVRNFKPETISEAFNHFANTIIEWHSDFLLHADRHKLAQFFEKVAAMAQGDNIGPVAAVIRKFTQYVTRKGGDESVAALREALTPVTFSPVRIVSTEGMRSQRRATEVYDGAVLSF